MDEINCEEIIKQFNDDRNIYYDQSVIISDKIKILNKYKIHNDKDKIKKCLEDNKHSHYKLNDDNFFKEAFLSELSETNINTVGPTTTSDKIISHVDLFPELQAVFIAGEAFTNEALKHKFGYEGSDPESLVPFLKKVFQSKYPITRSNGLPKIPTNKHDKKMLLDALEHYFHNLRYDIIKHKQKYGNSVSLRQQIDHLQKIKILMEHFEEDKVSFPYHLFQDYLDNQKFVEFEKDLIEALTKVHSIENEDTRIKNLLRQFTKLYLTKPANDEFDLHDPGLSEAQFLEFEKKLGKRVPEIIVDLMRVLSLEKDVSRKEEVDLEPLYKLLRKFEYEIEFMSGGGKKEKDLENIINDVFTKILDKYRELKSNCSSKDAAIEGHKSDADGVRSELAAKEAELAAWKSALEERDRIIVDERTQAEKYINALEERDDIIVKKNEEITQWKNSFDKWKDHYEEEIKELDNKLNLQLQELAEKDENINHLFDKLINVKKLVNELRKERRIGDSEAYQRLKHMFEMDENAEEELPLTSLFGETTNSNFENNSKNKNEALKQPHTSLFGETTNSNFENENKPNVGNIKPPISSANSPLPNYLGVESETEAQAEKIKTIKNITKNIESNTYETQNEDIDHLVNNVIYEHLNNNKFIMDIVNNPNPSQENINKGSKYIEDIIDEAFKSVKITRKQLLSLKEKVLKHIHPKHTSTSINLTEPPHTNIMPKQQKELLPTIKENENENNDRARVHTPNKMITSIGNNKNNEYNAEVADFFGQDGGSLHKICESVAYNKLSKNLCNEENNPILDVIDQFEKKSQMKVFETSNEKYMLHKFFNKLLKNYFEDSKHFFYEAKQILQKKHYSKMLYELYNVSCQIKKSKKTIDVVKYNEYVSLYDELENLIQESNYDFYSEANKILPSKNHISLKFSDNSIYFYTNSNSFENTYEYVDGKFESKPYDFNEEIYFVNDKVLYLLFIINSYFEVEKVIDDLPIIHTLNKYVRTQKRHKKSIKKLLKERLDG